MKLAISVIAILLLGGTTFIGAYSGYRLNKDPDGSTLHLSADALKDVPFKDYKIPGILFFITVSLTGSLAIVLTAFQQKNHAQVIIAAGVILVMWILMLMALVPSISPVMHILLYTGISQVLCGLKLEKIQESNDRI